MKSAPRYELWELQLYWLVNYALCPVKEISKAELDRLPEYSHTQPTGVTVGKKWRRREDVRGFDGDRLPGALGPCWLLQEYAPSLTLPDTHVRVVTYRAVVINGP